MAQEPAAIGRLRRRLVLEALVERLRFDRVVISAYGLREGLLLDRMPPEVRARQPLLEGCEALSIGRGLSPDLAHSLEAWLTPSDYTHITEDDGEIASEAVSFWKDAAK